MVDKNKVMPKAFQ